MTEEARETTGAVDATQEAHATPELRATNGAEKQEGSTPIAESTSTSTPTSTSTSTDAAALEAAVPRSIPRAIWRVIRDYFAAEDPTFSMALVPMCFLSMALFTRHPRTNFIFDEQEALLANPYVRSIADPASKMRWIDAFYRDFWGLPADRSIGSYRPIPDLIWRALWGLGARDQTPFIHHWVNVLLHGTNGALVTVIVMHVTKRRQTAWLAGAIFTASAVLTEAVSGVVGIADVLGATGALLALIALRFSMKWMPFAVFAAMLFGLYSKESALSAVPLVPFCALLTSQITHPSAPRRLPRALLAALATGAAFLFYVEARRRMFPAPLPQELSIEENAGKPLFHRVFSALLRWYAQPALPRDPLNNPLVKAEPAYRVAGALRVYTRGLWQIVCPWTLSGDYSSPQEPIPTRLFFPESIVGGLMLVLPIPIALWLGRAAYKHAKNRATVAETHIEDGPYRAGTHRAPPIEELDTRPVVGAALAWIAVFYFPVSNIPVLLPTVRAERFWYFPALATSLLLAMSFTMLLDEARVRVWMRRSAIAFLCAFMLFQCVAARLHANDYTDDLSFWDATRKAVPNSAKAHLNYSVMKGARGDLPARLESNGVALRLAPEWPMASVYYGDTLCRMHRAPEAWPYYKRGFLLAPNDVNLIALGLQCMWDEQQLKFIAEGPDRTVTPLEAELKQMSDDHPGTWLEYLVTDLFDKGVENNGVDPKHRPRGYNEGPKE